MDNIKSVELIEYHPFPDEDGNKIAVLNPHFLLTQEDGDELRVPFDPLNRHYIEISEWYKEQKKKPFEFDFKNNKPK